MAGTSPHLKKDRPLVGLSFGGAFGGDIDAALDQYVTAWNTGGVSGHVVECYTHYMYPSLTATSVDYPYDQINNFTGQVIWSMQGFPSGGSYANLLAGNYLSNIQTIGARLAAQTPYAIVRYAWECDGNWFPWGLGAGNSISQLQDAWGYVVPILRSEGFLGPMEFNCVNENGYDPLVIAPDPSLYDLVGLDKYIGHGDMSKSSDWPYCWTTFQKPVYDRAADLAARDGKRISISECSTGIRYGDYTYDSNGNRVYQPAPGWMCGDDDYGLIHLAEWIRQHDVAIWSIFEGNDQYGSSGTNYYGSYTSTDIKNRFAWLTAATPNQAGPFSRDLTNFPNSVAWWQGSGSLSENLVQESAVVTPPPQVSTSSPRRGRINQASRFDMSWYG